MRCNVYVKHHIYITKVHNIVIKVIYIACRQPVAEVSCNVIDFARVFKSTVLLLRPVDPNSFLPFLDLSFKLGPGLWIITGPSFGVKDGSDCVVCLGSGLHYSYSEAESLNLGSILTSIQKFLAMNLLFCTDIQSGSVVLNDKEGQVQLRYLQVELGVDVCFIDSDGESG